MHSDNAVHKGMDMAAAGEPAAVAPSIIVVGLGNPILGDDGAGWKVAEAVKAAIGKQAQTVEVDCASLGGLSLMERILGYRHVVLVDTMQSGGLAEGAVNTFRLDDLPHPEAGHTTSAHDASLITALKTARLMGAAVPDRVDVVAIEALTSNEFSEELTPPIAAAIPIATRKVVELLGLSLDR